jgi:hypothetical protein
MKSVLRLAPLTLLLGLFLLAGCASTINKSDSTRPTSAKSNFGKWLGKGQESSVFYHDFEDVLIPSEMKLLSKDSILFETPQVKTGVLVYEGRVDAVSLFNFFMGNMPKDNWTVRSYFKYNRYLLVFEKPEKDCIITIVDRPMSTLLEISVAPRLMGSGQMSSTSPASFGQTGGYSSPSGSFHPVSGQVLSE